MLTTRAKEPWFLEINPNGRIPAMTDTFTDGKPIRIFESGSMLQYLIERYDKEHKLSYPYGSREYWEVNNWVSSPASVDLSVSNGLRSCGKWVGSGLCRGRFLILRKSRRDD